MFNLLEPTANRGSVWRISIRRPPSIIGLRLRLLNVNFLVTSFTATNAHEFILFTVPKNGDRSTTSRNHADKQGWLKITPSDDDSEMLCLSLNWSTLPLGLLQAIKMHCIVYTVLHTKVKNFRVWVILITVSASTVTNLSPRILSLYAITYTCNSF